MRRPFADIKTGKIDALCGDGVLGVDINTKTIGLKGQEYV